MNRDKAIIETLREGNRELRAERDALAAVLRHIMELGLLRGSPRLRDEALKILDGIEPSDIEVSSDFNN